MNTSVSSRVRDKIKRLPRRSFIRPAIFDGAPSAVEAELSRLARSGEILRVRKGLYWKGPKTRLGIAAPDPELIALEVAGRGAGPAGIAAAHRLGLTSQVPGLPSVAVPGKPPSPVPGVTFRSRSFSRREIGMRPLEVALVEVLIDWPSSTEVDWDEMRTKVAALTESRAIRLDTITADVEVERRPALRERWAELLPDLVDA